MIEPTNLESKIWIFRLRFLLHNSTFDIINCGRLILSKRLCNTLSNLCEQKFKHSFLDTLTQVSNYGIDIETRCHLHYVRGTVKRQFLWVINIQRILESGIPSFWSKSWNFIYQTEEKRLFFQKLITDSFLTILL